MRGMLEAFDVRVEVEDSAILLVFPRKMDDVIVPWQQAMDLGQVMEQAAGDVPVRPLVINPGALNVEQAQIKLAVYKRRFVAMFFDHADRVRFSPDAAVLAGRALRKVAQDSLLKGKKVHLVYNRHNMLKKCFNEATGLTQIIPGR